MPMFHFEVRTPTHVLITQGAECANHTEARIEAARCIGVLLNEHAGQIWMDQDWDMAITDSAGLILYSIHVTALKSAATLESP